MINIINIDRVFNNKLEKKDKTNESSFVKFSEGGKELVQIFTKFSKVEKSDDGKNYFWAYISSDSIDSDGEIIQPSAIEEAWPEYEKWGTLREMHQNIIAGKVLESGIDPKNGLRWIKSIVTDDIAKKIKEGMILGVSVGGEVLERIGNIITKLNLFEISVVDRPANPDALIFAYKRYKEENSNSNSNIGEEEMNEELKKAGFTIQDLISLLKSVKKEDKKEEKPEDKKDPKVEENKEEDKKEEDKKEDKKDESDKAEKSLSLDEVLSGLDVIFKNTESKEDALNKSFSVLASTICDLADKEEIVFNGEEEKFEEVSKSLELLKSFKNAHKVEVNTEDKTEELTKTIKTLQDEIAELKSTAVFETKTETKTVKKSLKTNSKIEDAGVVEEAKETLEELEKSINLARETFNKSHSVSDNDKLIQLLMKKNMLQS